LFIGKPDDALPQRRARTDGALLSLRHGKAASCGAHPCLCRPTQPLAFTSCRMPPEQPIFREKGRIAD